MKDRCVHEGLTSELLAPRLLTGMRIPHMQSVMRHRTDRGSQAQTKARKVKWVRNASQAISHVYSLTKLANVGNSSSLQKLLGYVQTPGS